jgi:RNA polymerase sigma factor (sigma-70 family)
VEASALQAPAGLARTRLSIGVSLLRLRSDEQLVALFRGGNEEAFRIIHDRYRTRLFAYTRQMLPGSRHDAEDALQDIFVRAYSGLRANNRELSLRAWLYRVAHNRCVDELRKPAPPAPEVLGILRAPSHDPTAEAEQRESLRRLIADVRRLPEQQRSALLMRELGGMAYADVAAALGTSVPAVKSLLVRARVSLAQALEARDTACAEIREELVVAHDRGVRPSGLARRHMHDCPACREFRGQMRGVSRQFAALAPTLGPLGVIANVLGIGGGAGASGGAAAAGPARARQRPAVRSGRVALWHPSGPSPGRATWRRCSRPRS